MVPGYGSPPGFPKPPKLAIEPAPEHPNLPDRARPREAVANSESNVDEPGEGFVPSPDRPRSHCMDPSAPRMTSCERQVCPAPQVRRPLSARQVHHSGSSELSD